MNRNAVPLFKRLGIALRQNGELIESERKKRIIDESRRGKREWRTSWWRRDWWTVGSDWNAHVSPRSTPVIDRNFLDQPPKQRKWSNPTNPSYPKTRWRSSSYANVLFRYLVDIIESTRTGVSNIPEIQTKEKYRCVRLVDTDRPVDTRRLNAQRRLNIRGGKFFAHQRS